MAYSLGNKSRKRLEGVHLDLVKVVKRAIKITNVDFTVLEGLRSKARQKQLVRKGAAKTMNPAFRIKLSLSFSPEESPMSKKCKRNWRINSVIVIVRIGFDSILAETLD